MMATAEWSELYAVSDEEIMGLISKFIV